jgi:outer membrane protein assembly factor BamB
MNARLLILVVLLAPLASLAQESWSATWQSGSAVMEEVSPLTFEIRNTSSAARQLTEVVLTLKNSYNIEAGTAPAGWAVQSVDLQGRRITFRATDACPNAGLAPGQGALFTLHVAGMRSNRDQAGETFVNGTYARDACANRTLVPNLTNATWQLLGLSTRLVASRRTLGVGEQTSLLLVVDNRSSQSQNAIQLDSLQLAGTATFTLTPLTPPLNLAAGASGTFIVQAQATGEGTATAEASASNDTVSSAVASSPLLSVRPLAAKLEVSPASAFSGDMVTVRLTVSNTSTSDTYRAVVPRTPTSVGKAVASLVSGPQPASVTSLAPGQVAQFSWKYQLSGAQADDYRFQALADAVRSGAPVTTELAESPAGQLLKYRLSANPVSFLAGATNVVISYTIVNQGPEAIRELRLLQPPSGPFTVAASPFVNTPAGWSPSIAGGDYLWLTTGAGIPPGGSLTVGLRFSNITGVSSNGTTFDIPYSHRMRMRLASGLTARAEVPVTVMANRSIAEVSGLVALAGEGRNTLTWTNPDEHGGVLVLRSTGAPPNTAPAPGLRYAVGGVLGNALIVHAGEFDTSWRLADSAVTNGTEYFYRVFNHDDLFRYAAGNQPTSLGIRSTPRQRGPGAPLWCYSVGFAALQQPITELGRGIFTSFNDSVVANLTNVGTPTLDGDERWRPVKLSGLIGSRFPVVPLHGLPGQYLLVGDQAGGMYAINAYTGEVLWRGDNGQSLGVIQSFPVTQLYDYANAAYRAAHPNRDLVLFASRNGTTDNKVIALNAATGQRVWLYAPGDLDMVSGGMLVDYTGNRLFVAAKSNGNSQASLRVLSTLNGQELARLSLGDIEHSVVRNPLDNHVYVTASNGTVYGVSLADLTVRWSTFLGAAPTSFVRPLGTGFHVGLQSGVVEYHSVLPDGAGGFTVTRKWQTPIATPSGVFSYSTSSARRLYVGSSDGKVHELDAETGVDLQQVSLGPAQRIGTPTVDHVVGRLHVGTQDGRICAYTVPFP